jgi:ATP-dependent HslUV protease ATP-binding subunit HslU
MKNFTPQEIVSELDKYIVGQNSAKKSVAIALRNRWRRKQLPENLQKEVIPKNILMIGPTGVGKTEIARRLAKLDNAPFIKVEATKFTEIGYVGRDVEQIIRDLIEIAIHLKSDELKKSVRAQAEKLAINKIINILAGESASPETKKKFKEKYQNGELNSTEIEIQVKEKSGGQPMFEVPGMPGAQMGMISLDNILGREKLKNKTVTVEKAFNIFVEEESDQLIDKDVVIAEAIDAVENNGIVFIDEIDKIASSYSERRGGDVSREGVQRDLLPLVEGTTVNTKYGPIKTDHVLFVASGAFHLSKPSDLLPELQGRFPIRVELSPLNKEEFKRILTEPKANLILQYTQMLKTEGVDVVFEDEAIDEIAYITEYFNKTIEDIGARRLHTILEKILEEINFTAPEKSGTKVIITKDIVKEKVSYLTNNMDLSKFII